MINLLIALVVILTISALIQLVRVNELLSEITNQDPNAVTDDDNNKNGIFFLLTIPLFLGFVIWQMITWDHLLLPPASSVHGAEIDALMKVSKVPLR